jgi:hypothetical protein
LVGTGVRGQIVARDPPVAREIANRRTGVCKLLLKKEIWLADFRIWLVSSSCERVPAANA